MADSAGTLQTLIKHLVLALQPLKAGVADLPAFRTLLFRLGWNVTSLPPEYTALAAKVDQALGALTALGNNPTPSQVLSVLDQVKAVYAAVKALTTAPDGVNASEFLPQFAESLFELLLADYLNTAFPSVHSALLALDILTEKFLPQTPSRPAVVLTAIQWDQIPKVLTDPGSLPAIVYGWGTPNFDFHRLAGNLLELFVAIDWPAYLGRVDAQLGRGFKDSPDDPTTSIDWGLKLPVWADNLGGQEVEVGLALLELPAQGAKLPGLILQPLLPSAAGTSFNLTDELILQLQAGTNLASTFGLLVRPGDLSVKFPLQPGTALPEAGVQVTLQYQPPAPALLLGTPGQTRLEIKGAATSLGVQFKDGQFEIRADAAPQRLNLILAAADLDGFLGELLGGGDHTMPILLDLRWSNRGGFSFSGGAGFTLSTYPHLALGPLRVDELDLSVLAAVSPGQAPNVALQVTAAVGGTLGPISFSALGIGLKLAVAFTEGNAGPLDLQFGFKPPDGIGLEVDGGGFTGGGFAKYDSSKGEYSGGIDLVFQDTIALHGFAILSTQMPDGTKGFSLLILISAEFEPIQLGLGFTLLGVGGLLGVNRGAAIDVLRNGLKDGSLQNLLFPANVVADAGQLLSGLDRIFPAQPGSFLVGPTAKIGWGTPALVTIQLGLVLELPRTNLVLLGTLRTALPVDDEPIVLLQVAFVGTVDFSSGQLEFDASLYDSRVVNFTLSGDMAVRVYWKQNANLLLSVGGFHPAYTPPPMDLPPMARLGIVLFPDNPHVRAEAYLAITSNTLQVGARVEVSYNLSSFNVYGFLSFDVLIQRKPFHFVADIAAQVAVRAGTDVLFSIKLQFTLEGPGPWHAHGTGSFEIGFIFTITIQVGFDITSGSPSSDAALAAIDVLGALVDALGTIGNWSASLPPGLSPAVTLRPTLNQNETLILQPAGSLEVTQKVVPLNIAVQRFGAAVPSSPGTYSITAANFGATIAPDTFTQDEFAPAQFFDMTDAEKLSRPSFALYDAGISIGGELGPSTDYMQARDVAYEVIYVPEHQPAPRFRIPAGLAIFSSAGSAVARSSISQARNAPSPLSQRAGVVADRYTVVSTDDLSLHDPSLVFDTATHADQALQSLLAHRPELSGMVQVMPAAAVPDLQLLQN